MRSGILALAIAAILVGASSGIHAQLPGAVKERHSKFDGATEIYMAPAWVAGSGWESSYMKMGLFWKSGLPTGDVVLTISVYGANSISTGDSLHFNIDGELAHFSSMDVTTDFEYHPGHHSKLVSLPGATWSSKRYTITRDFLERIMAATRVVVKVDLGTEYMEQFFSEKAGKGLPTTAKPSVRKFLAKLPPLAPAKE